jgi:hypothetical protein
MKGLLFFIIFISFNGQANEAKLKAWTIYNRINGVPPSPTSNTLNLMSNRINQFPGIIGLEEAAKLAIEEPYFYDIVLKNWLKPMSNQEQAKRIPLNDFVATIIGAIRDSDQPNKPFSRILYDDMIYVGPSLNAESSNFSRRNNNHYTQIENQRLNLKTVLVERKQSENINTEATITDNNNLDQTNVVVNNVNGAAGIFTTRQAGMAFYNMGTNRRVTRYAFLNFMCHDFEDLHDTTIADFRVRKDVERNPGGDSRAYKNTCVGCHAGQDALGGAFAHYDWVGNNRLQFTPNQVVAKMNRNADFAPGYQTTNDSWINLWAEGQNAALGWRGPQAGNGPAQLGQMLASSRAFSVCMAKRVFKLVCIRPPSVDDQYFIDQMADQLEANDSYNMKNLFVKTVAKCVEAKYEN